MKMTYTMCEVSEQDFPWLSSSYSHLRRVSDAPSPSCAHKRSLFHARQDGRGLLKEELAADWLAAQQYSVACTSRCSGSRVGAYMWGGYADTKAQTQSREIKPPGRREVDRRFIATASGPLLSRGPQEDAESRLAAWNIRELSPSVSNYHEYITAAYSACGMPDVEEPSVVRLAWPLAWWREAGP